MRNKNRGHIKSRKQRSMFTQGRRRLASWRVRYSLYRATPVKTYKPKDFKNFMAMLNELYGK